MDRAYTAKTLATAAACLAVVVPLIGGFIVPGHSHVVNFISELGAVGTQWGAVVSWAGFLPIGVLTLGFLIVAAPLLRLQGAAKVGYWLLSFIGIAYVGSAFAPCDLGCPVSGSPTQLAHNLMGLMEYLGGGIGLLVFSTSYFKDSNHDMLQSVLFFAGVIVLAALTGITMQTLSAWHGLIQWVGEVGLFGSVVLIAWRIIPTPG